MLSSESSTNINKKTKETTWTFSDLSLIMHSFNFNDSQSMMYWLCYEMLLPNSSKHEKSMIYDKQSKTPTELSIELTFDVNQKNENGWL